MAEANKTPNVSVLWADVLRDAGVPNLRMGGSKSEDYTYEDARRRAQEKGKLAEFDRLTKVFSTDPDPGLTAVADAQKSQSAFFDQNMDRFREQLASGIQANARRELTQSNRGVNRDFNRRGLLYSGGVGAQKAKNRGAINAGASESIYNVNQELQGLSNQLRQAPINTMLTAQGKSAQAVSSGLNNQQNSILQALKERNLNTKGFGDFLTGINKLQGLSAGG